jgi:transcriptional regulator with XRE-family HTH domain
MTANERLKILRKEILRITQEAMADKLNISRSNLASIESGRIALTNRVINDICRIYDINEKWLNEGTEPIFSDEKQRDKIICDIMEIYNLLSPEFKNYLIGYAHRLLDEQTKNNC